MFSGGVVAAPQPGHLLRCPALVSPERPGRRRRSPAPHPFSPVLTPHPPPPNTPPRAPVTPPLRGGRLSGWSWKGSASPDSARFQGSEADAASSSPGAGAGLPTEPASGSRLAGNASWDAPGVSLMGKVIAAGPGTADVKMEVKVGDMVMYGKYAGAELNYEGETYLVMKQADIIAVIE